MRSERTLRSVWSAALAAALCCGSIAHADLFSKWPPKMGHYALPAGAPCTASQLTDLRVAVMPDGRLLVRAYHGSGESYLNRWYLYDYDYDNFLSASKLIASGDLPRDGYDLWTHYLSMPDGRVLRIRGSSRWGKLDLYEYQANAPQGTDPFTRIKGAAINEFFYPSSMGMTEFYVMRDGRIARVLAGPDYNTAWDLFRYRPDTTSIVVSERSYQETEVGPLRNRSMAVMYDGRTLLYGAYGGWTVGSYDRTSDSGLFGATSTRGAWTNFTGQNVADCGPIPVKYKMSQYPYTYQWDCGASLAPNAQVVSLPDARVLALRSGRWGTYPDRGRAPMGYYCIWDRSYADLPFPPLHTWSVLYNTEVASHNGNPVAVALTAPLDVNLHGFKTVSLTNEGKWVGGCLSHSSGRSEIVPTAYQVLSDGKHLYLFVETYDFTIRSERYVVAYDGTVHKSRYCRAENTGTEDDPHYDYTYPWEEAAHAPDLGNVHQGAFAVQLVRADTQGQDRWVIFKYDRDTDNIELHTYLRAGPPEPGKPRRGGTYVEGYFAYEDRVEANGAQLGENTVTIPKHTVRNLFPDDAQYQPILRRPAAVELNRIETSDDGEDYLGDRRLMLATVVGQYTPGHYVRRWFPVPFGLRRPGYWTNVWVPAGISGHSIEMIDFAILSDGTLLPPLDVQTDAEKADGGAYHDVNTRTSSTRFRFPDLVVTRNPVVYKSMDGFVHLVVYGQLSGDAEPHGYEAAYDPKGRTWVTGGGGRSDDVRGAGCYVGSGSHWMRMRGQLYRYAPSVVEYAGVEWTAQDNNEDTATGHMNRIYMGLRNTDDGMRPHPWQVEKLVLLEGELIDTTIVDATLAGYIEGPPPIPAYQIPAAKGDKNNVTLTESDTAKYTWRHEFEHGACFEAEGYAGFGWEAFGGMVGVAAKVEWDKGWSSEQYTQGEQRVTRTKTCYVPEDNIELNYGFAQLMGYEGLVYALRPQDSKLIVCHRIKPTRTRPYSGPGSDGAGWIPFRMNPNYREVGKPETYKDVGLARRLACEVQRHAKERARYYEDVKIERVVRDDIQDMSNAIVKNMMVELTWYPGMESTSAMDTAGVTGSTSGGSFNFKGMAGVTWKAEGTGFVSEGKILAGGFVNLKTSKEEEQEHASSLELDVWLENSTEEDMNYYCDGLHWYTFYLQSRNSHWDHFWTNVIDRDWLNSSSDQDSAAERDAKEALLSIKGRNPCWRLTHVGLMYSTKQKSEARPQAAAPQEDPHKSLGWK